MAKQRFPMAAAGPGALAALLLSGLLFGGAPPAGAAERVITLLAVEPKGRTSVRKEPFPGTPLPPGGGYELKTPDKTGRWQVSAYVFSPAQVIVRKGDRVRLRVLGVNGARHTVTIERYRERPFIIRRGKLTEVAFTADRAGVFRIGCADHPPSMTGELIVLDN